MLFLPSPAFIGKRLLSHPSSSISAHPLASRRSLPLADQSLSGMVSGPGSSRKEEPLLKFNVYVKFGLWPAPSCRPTKMVGKPEPGPSL